MLLNVMQPQRSKTSQSFTTRKLMQYWNPKWNRKWTCIISDFKCLFMLLFVHLAYLVDSSLTIFTVRWEWMMLYVGCTYLTFGFWWRKASASPWRCFHSRRTRPAPCEETYEQNVVLFYKREQAHFMLQHKYSKTQVTKRQTQICNVPRRRDQKVYSVSNQTH